jgi:hypothetical protein
MCIFRLIRPIDMSRYHTDSPPQPNHIWSAVSLTLHRTLTIATKQKSNEDKTLLLADGRTLLTAFWRKNKRRHGAGLGPIFKSAVRNCAMETDEWRIPIPMTGHAEG